MSNNRKDVLSSIFFMVLAIAYFCGTFAIKSYNAFGVTVLSSASVPRALAVGLLLLSVINLLTGLKKTKQDTEVAAKTENVIQEEAAEGGVDIKKRLAEAEKNEAPQDECYSDVLKTLGLLVVYVIGLAYLGFIIATFLYIIAQAYLMTQVAVRKSKMVFICILSAIATAAIYFLFNNCLSLMLPVGIFGF